MQTTQLGKEARATEAPGVERAFPAVMEAADLSTVAILRTAVQALPVRAEPMQEIPVDRAVQAQELMAAEEGEEARTAP